MASPQVPLAMEGHRGRGIQNPIWGAMDGLMVCILREPLDLIGSQRFSDVLKLPI